VTNAACLRREPPGLSARRLHRRHNRSRLRHYGRCSASSRQDLSSAGGLRSPPESATRRRCAGPYSGAMPVRPAAQAGKRISQRISQESSQRFSQESSQRFSRKFRGFTLLKVAQNIIYICPNHSGRIERSHPNPVRATQGILASVYRRSARLRRRAKTTPARIGPVGASHKHRPPYPPTSSGAAQIRTRSRPNFSRETFKQVLSQFCGPV